MDILIKWLAYILLYRQICERIKQEILYSQGEDISPFFDFLGVLILWRLGLKIWP